MQKYPSLTLIFLVAQLVKNLPAMWENRVWSLGWEDPLGKGTATYSSNFAWRIPWKEEPGRLQSMGLQRVGHDWATFLSLSLPSLMTHLSEPPLGCCPCYLIPKWDLPYWSGPSAVFNAYPACVPAPCCDQLSQGWCEWMHLNRTVTLIH